MESFTVHVTEAEIAELHRRLDHTRWPDAETVGDWSQGIPLDYLKDLCAHWRHGYDWRRCENRLNALPQFRHNVDGLGIHFLHVRSPHPDALPLVLTHGWPGSIVEFLDALGPLTDPTAHGGDAGDAFHVVCPSLPGYGFSDKPSQPGWGVERIARAWAQLMAELGYDRYGAQGGDWGSAVTEAIGVHDPDHVVGIHLNMVFAGPSKEQLAELTPQESAALEAGAHYQRWDSGYSTQQASRPQTVGYGLADSPTAQCAWIVEKFWSWTDCDGLPDNALSRDQMLDNVSLYWFTNTATSSARLYWESFHRMRARDTLTVPVGCSIFPKEIFRASRRWAEARFPTLSHWKELERGGHFAAFEQPEAFVDEVRTCFRSMR